MQWKKINKTKIATWNVSTLYRAGAVGERAQETEKYKTDICALQEIRLPGEGTMPKKNYMILYSGNKNGKHEFGIGFYVNRQIMDNIIDSEPVNYRICKIRVKLKFYNLRTSILAPTEGEDLVKEQLYMSLQKVCDTAPNYNTKVILGDFNVRIGKENYWYPACGRYSLHDKTNDNGKKMADFAVGRDLFT
jgi:exonuclease III